MAYHQDFNCFCKTCYGGGACQNPNVHKKGGANGQCADGKCTGVPECSYDIPGIETCRKCGLFGRMFLYECKRLAYGQKGGEGCNPPVPKCGGAHRHFGSLMGAGCRTCGMCDSGCGCDSCDSCDAHGCGKGHHGCSKCHGLKRFDFIARVENWKDRPIGGYGALTGPYRYRYYTYGWREGPMQYYGPVVGAYETYLAGNYNDRGPLNSGPMSWWLTSTAPAATEEVPSPPTPTAPMPRRPMNGDMAPPMPPSVLENP